MKAIVAVTKDNIIGDEVGLIWNCPADLRHFCQLTSGHYCIVGRKTYDTMPILSNRTCVIMSKTGDVNKKQKCDIVCKSVEECLSIIHGKQSWIIGGQEIYSLFAEYCREIVMTVIDGVTINNCKDYKKFGMDMSGYKLVSTHNICSDAKVLTFRK